MVKDTIGYGMQIKSQNAWPDHPALPRADSVAGAQLFVSAPSTMLGQMDCYPQKGPTEGPALDLSAFAGDVAPECDFNGSSKGGMTFRGAYAGAGQNPGWKLAAEPKAQVSGCGCRTAGHGNEGLWETFAAAGAAAMITARRQRRARKSQ